MRESLLAGVLSRTDATAYNPFDTTFKVQNGAVMIDQPYTNPQAVTSTFVRVWRREGFSSIGSFDLRASGELFHTWSGPISLAFGGEFRREHFVDHREPFAGLDPNNDDFITASPKPDSRGDRDVGSACAEVVLPLVSPDNNVPLVQSLELSTSARFENHPDFGTTTKPRFGVNEKPFQGAMVRASCNEGCTAPNLPTLHAPTQYIFDSQPGAVDTAYTQQQLGSGTANHKGSPNIVRNAPTAADIATFAACTAGRPASRRMAVAGQIFSRNVAFQNIAQGDVSGWDVGVHYKIPETEFGRFRVSTDWTYLIRSTFAKNAPNPALITQDRLNVDGTTRWRGNGVVAWSGSSWNASLSACYIGKFQSSSATTTAAVYPALGEPGCLAETFDSGSYVYRHVVNDPLTFNASVGYSFPRGCIKMAEEHVRAPRCCESHRQGTAALVGKPRLSNSACLSLLPGRTWTLDLTRRF